MEGMTSLYPASIRPGDVFLSHVDGHPRTITGIRKLAGNSLSSNYEITSEPEGGGEESKFTMPSTHPLRVFMKGEQVEVKPVPQFWHVHFSIRGFGYTDIARDENEARSSAIALSRNSHATITNREGLVATYVSGREVDNKTGQPVVANLDVVVDPYILEMLAKVEAITKAIMAALPDPEAVL